MRSGMCLVSAPPKESPRLTRQPRQTATSRDKGRRLQGDRGTSQAQKLLGKSGRFAGHLREITDWVLTGRRPIRAQSVPLRPVYRRNTGRNLWAGLVGFGRRGT